MSSQGTMENTKNHKLGAAVGRDIRTDRHAMLNTDHEPLDLGLRVTIRTEKAIICRICSSPLVG